MRYYLKIGNRALFVLLVVILLWAYFAKDNYRSVDVIHPSTTQAPIQTDRFESNPIKFEKDGYKYDLTPLFDFDINALIVSKLDYRKWSLSKKDSVFPFDLALIWGNNVKSKVFQSNDLHFSQDMRQVRYYYSGNLDVNKNEVANVHVVIKDEFLEDAIDDFQIGDQVKITGALVNIKAVNTTETDVENPQELTIETSTVRDDEGPGACEVLYVSGVSVLESADLFPNTIFNISFYSLIIFVIGNIIWFLISSFLLGSKLADSN